MVLGIATRQVVQGQALTVVIASGRVLALVDKKGCTLADWNASLANEPPLATEALYFTGMDRLLSDDYNKALALFEEVARRNPNDAEARLHCGYVKARVKRYAEALRDYQTAARLAPEHHVLLRVDQDRVRRRHAVAHGEADKAAVDLHRLLQFVLEHLLHEERVVAARVRAVMMVAIMVVACTVAVLRAVLVRTALVRPVLAGRTAAEIFWVNSSSSSGARSLTAQKSRPCCVQWRTL